ncbi:MAG: FKBP-type peptidyl-prolyl cis-trans isomerase [Clostridiales bacterium]|nr:FKBP-type peptidyl-prolyl cis-trans isomerase [Clostridiales bacterium]
MTWDDGAEATEDAAEMDDSEEAEITEETDTTTTDSGDSEASEEEASYSTDSSLTVADGDTVNIDYTGYIDDVAFDGGSTNGSGTDLTIGSGSYIDDFEEQLIGYHPGDTVSVTVTFPEDYGNEELNG